MKQSIENKQGEIEFRRKLVEQQVYGETHFDDEFDADKIEDILKSRMVATLEDMELLKSNNTPLSPYLELGAERGQRSLIMENDLGCSGAALDISFDMLKSCSYYRTKFGKEKIPVRICCDAYHLPFLSNSIPFIFCYQVLHHFPNPGIIIEELHRVLSAGGTLYFNEEPFKKVAHFNLYQRDSSSNSISKDKKGFLKRIMDFFFSYEKLVEHDYSIVENDDITLADWKQYLAFFREKNIEIHSLKGINSELFTPRNAFNYFLTYLLGGTIRGTCKKDGQLSIANAEVSAALACPMCRTNGLEAQLKAEHDYLLCQHCGKKYPIIDGVMFLLADDKFASLYPELATL